MPKIRLDGIEYPVTPEAENVFSRYLAEANRYAEIGNLPVSSARKFESRLAGLIGQTVFETNGTEATKIIAKLGSVESVYSDILGNGPGERLTGEFAETPERNFDSGLPGKGTRELSESSGLPRKGTGEFAEILGAPLVRDGKNGILFGVAAGIGKRWDIDPIYVRLAFLVGSFFYVGFFAYVALIFLMEKDPSAAAPADLWLSRADGFASKTNRNGAVPANGGAFQGSGSFAAPTVSAFAQNANPFDAMPRAAGGEAWGFFRMIQKLFSIGISAIVLFTFVPLAVFLVFASMLTSSGYEMYNQVIF
jgi:phage shock protein PspC (stress-responsive transcriptional regulator)